MSANDQRSPLVTAPGQGVPPRMAALVGGVTKTKSVPCLRGTPAVMYLESHLISIDWKGRKWSILTAKMNSDSSGYLLLNKVSISSPCHHGGITK